MLQVEEQARRLAGVGLVDEHRAALEELAVTLEHEIDGGAQERVARADQLGAGLLVDLVLLEAHPLVTLEHRGALTDVAVALAQRRGHVGDLEAPLFAAVDPPAKAAERLEEEGLDEVGLQPPGVGTLHLFAQRLDAAYVHGVVHQGALVEEPLELVAVDHAFHRPVEPRLHLGIVAVADGVHEHLAQGLLVEEPPEHVVDLAAQRLALDLELLQEPHIHVALAGVLGDEVPQVADLALADAVDAAEALLEPVGVPGQVVVHHQVGTLQVHALARGVVGDEDQHLGIVHEGVNDPAALLAGHRAVDLYHGLVPAEPVADAATQVGERVLELAEDDELPPVAVVVDHQRVVEDGVELVPLGVLARAHHGAGQVLEPLEPVDLDLQLLDGGRRGGVVDQLGLELLALLLRGLVVGLVVEVLVDAVEHRVADLERSCSAAQQKTRLTQAALQALAATGEGAVDRLGGRGQPPLENHQGEAHVHTSLALTGVHEAFGAVHLLAHVVRDLGVEVGLLGRELVLDGVRAALGEERLAVEAEEILLDQAPHQVGGIRGVNSVAELALESVAVEEREEDLEVLFLAVVRCGRHQQEVPAVGADGQPELVALG